MIDDVAGAEEHEEKTLHFRHFYINCLVLSNKALDES